MAPTNQQKLDDIWSAAFKQQIVTLLLATPIKDPDDATKSYTVAQWITNGATSAKHAAAAVANLPQLVNDAVAAAVKANPVPAQVDLTAIGEAVFQRFKTQENK